MLTFPMPMHALSILRLNSTSTTSMLDTTTLIDSVSALVQPWADIYANSAIIPTALLATHMLAMFVGGGMAIGADRAILRAKPGTADAVRAVVADLSTTHSVVIGALVMTVLSGLALLTSDVPTFAVSRVFWIKMGAFAILLINGMRMQRVEKGVLQGAGGVIVQVEDTSAPFPTKQWGGIRRSAGASLVLWMAIVVLGVVLTNG